MKIEIREPHLNEAGGLWHLAMVSKQYWGYSDEFMQACRDELKVSVEKLQSHSCYYRLAYDKQLCDTQSNEQKILGFYCLELIEDGCAEVDALFVDPEFIGIGVGRKLWDHMLELARHLKIETVKIASEPNAEAFYLKMGARRVGEIKSGSIANRTLPLMEVDVY